MSNKKAPKGPPAGQNPALVPTQSMANAPKRRVGGFLGFGGKKVSAGREAPPPVTRKESRGDWKTGILAMKKRYQRGGKDAGDKASALASASMREDSDDEDEVMSISSGDEESGPLRPMLKSGAAPRAAAAGKVNGSSLTNNQKGSA